ncbi:MAG: LysM peptidoglycan-binding domain-containing protein [Caldilineaceae bacterium]|nr:LysM peptidoglycan-binding domain-containing protein [Caldilineaceae bacterium]
MFHSDPEDIFAKAIERVEAGEAVEGVLASVPAELRPELREMLLLVTATHHLQRAPVPQTPAPRRAERKAAFLQAAAQMKPEAVVAPSPSSAPAPVAKATVAKPTQAPSPIVTWFTKFWQDLQVGLASPNLRLAPLLMIIAAVWASAFGFSSAAQAAGIGDLAYPVKQWIGYQELTLSPPAIRTEVYTNEIEIRLAEDLRRAQKKLETEASNTGQKKAITTDESLLIFKGIDRGSSNGDEDDLFLIGPLRVMPKYQPDPDNDQHFEAMQMPGIPAVGSQVSLTFQVIAAAQDNASNDTVVQGVAMEIVQGQLAFTEDNTPYIPPAPLATPTQCAATPSSWVPYRIQPGDTLSELASQRGTTVAQLRAVNCSLSGDLIVAGGTLVLPSLPPTHTPVPVQTALEATLTAISTTVLTPSIDITATVTVVPTATASLTATATMTAEATSEITPTLTMTGTPTIETTHVATVTGVATATLTAIATPMPTEVISATVEPAAGTPIAPTMVAITSTVTGVPSTSPTMVETSEPSATATALPIPTVVSTLTPSSLTPTRTGPATGSTSGGTTLPTAISTPTPVPQSQSPLVDD